MVLCVTSLRIRLCPPFGAVLGEVGGVNEPTLCSPRLPAIDFKKSKKTINISVVLFYGWLQKWLYREDGIKKKVVKRQMHLNKHNWTLCTSIVMNLQCCQTRIRKKKHISVKIYCNKNSLLVTKMWFPLMVVSVMLSNFTNTHMGGVKVNRKLLSRLLTTSENHYACA